MKSISKNCPKDIYQGEIKEQIAAHNYKARERIAKEKIIWSSLIEALERDSVIEDERIRLYYDKRIKAMLERLPIEPNFDIRRWNEQLSIACSIGKEESPYPIFVRINQGVHIITQNNYFAYKSRKMAEFLQSCITEDGSYHWEKYTIGNAMLPAEKEEEEEKREEERQKEIESRCDSIVKRFEELIGWKDWEKLDDGEREERVEQIIEELIASAKAEPCYDKVQVAEEIATNCKTTPYAITSLQSNGVFVFGSNIQGVHSGSAGSAALKFGAIRGVSIGLQGQTYALPSEDLKLLALHINEFTDFAQYHPKLNFLVTEVGCGTSNHSPLQVAPLFKEAAKLANISLPPTFWDILNGGVGSRIKQLIEKGRYSIPSFANETGIPARILTDVLFGKVEPTFSMMQKILIAIPECDARWLMLGGR